MFIFVQNIEFFLVTQSPSVFLRNQKNAIFLYLFLFQLVVIVRSVSVMPSSSKLYLFPPSLYWLDVRVTWEGQLTSELTGKLIVAVSGLAHPYIIWYEYSSKDIFKKTLLYDSLLLFVRKNIRSFRLLSERCTLQTSSPSTLHITTSLDFVLVRSKCKMYSTYINCTLNCRFVRGLIHLL